MTTLVAVPVPGVGRTSIRENRSPDYSETTESCAGQIQRRI